MRLPAACAISKFFILTTHLYTKCYSSYQLIKPRVINRGTKQTGEVSIATVYKMDGPVFESRQKREIISSSKPYKLALAPTQLRIQLVPKFFATCKLAGV